jgi:uncharacterized protein (DUF2235 family)
MPKNIIICCDGTANQFSSDRTNVIKLFYTLIKGSADQVCYYHPGVGTMAPPGFVTKGGAFWARTAGMAFGYGLVSDIRDAYIFIINTYEAGDRLYLFGFSRGAYTVRVLAAMLRMYGLIERGNEPLVPYMVRMMWSITAMRRRQKPGQAEDLAVKQYFDMPPQFKATFSSPCSVQFVGVWDTVSSVGWFTNPVSLPYTAANQDIAIGRHAIAIDEHRAFFRTNVWRPISHEPGPHDLRQVWFPGVHCDVGGGYTEPESGLSKFSLEWMISEGKQAGLLTDPTKVDTVLGRNGMGYASADANARLHESLTSWWKLAEYVPKPHWNPTTGRTDWKANDFKRREMPAGAVVHDAAWDRRDNYADRLPQQVTRLSEMKWPAPA